MKNSSVRKIVITIAIVLIALLAAPVTLIITVFAMPSQFADTYYAEFADMTEKLYKTESKKIIFLGTSSVAFGIDSALMQSLAQKDGYDYAVCNYGLYGAMGFKVMLDSAEKAIKKDDIVVLAPELNSTISSLFFSAADVWRAVDGNFDLLNKIGKDDLSSMVGCFCAFAAEKYECLVKGEAVGSGVYAKSSFDENCDLKNYERQYNSMPGGVDTNNPVNFDIKLDKEYIDYVNAYAERAVKKGASAYYAFCPINAAAVSGEPGEFYDYLYDNLDFPILGNPEESVMEKEWFYDSNFHLNSAGMTVRTVNMWNDIKTAFGDSTPTDYPLPDKPPMKDDVSGGGDDIEDAACFTYEAAGNGYIITGLSETGKTKSRLVIPALYEGAPVTGIADGAFAGCTTLTSITIQENIRRLPDGLFDGCTELTEIILKQKDPTQVGVGFELLRGADKATVYVDEDAYSAYNGNYFWSYYALNGRLKSK